MKWWIAPIVMVMAASASAQDKTFTLTVTNQDLQVLSAGLDELPRKVSQPLVERLQKQLIAQMQPTPSLPAPPDAPPPQQAPAQAPAANPHPSF